MENTFYRVLDCNPMFPGTTSSLQYWTSKHKSSYHSILDTGLIKTWQNSMPKPHWPLHEDAIHKFKIIANQKQGQWGQFTPQEMLKCGRLKGLCAFPNAIMAWEY